MSKTRLEAFSDGVIAILITIMVLELQAPHGDDLAALRPLLPIFLTYVLSFVILGIYWNNHHHMLHLMERTTGSILWANLHLLFWLSLFPLVTSWMGENHSAAVPTAAYGIVGLGSAIAYTILQMRIIAVEGPRSRLAAAVQGDTKGKASLAHVCGSRRARLRQPVVLGRALCRSCPNLAGPGPPDRKTARSPLTVVTARRIPQ